MDYKMLSPTIVIRTLDGARVSPDDPKFLEWLDDGNSPFPPDPPSTEEIEAMR